ncbi:hypothetical protein KML002_14630 [Klebsiella quasipneumoniae subsp. similipneumoniae]|nr:hypothetical protein KML002_14630 [Klebsiella quasipneumoniae subsp. similipneumoniae]
MSKSAVALMPITKVLLKSKGMVTFLNNNRVRAVYIFSSNDEQVSWMQTGKKGLRCFTTKKSTVVMTFELFAISV